MTRISQRYMGEVTLLLDMADQRTANPRKPSDFPQQREAKTCRLTSTHGAGIPGPVNKQPPLNVVLYQPEIPPNTGNVGRTCVAVGAKLWLVRPLGFRMDVKSLRRAGLDYWQHLDWEAVDDWNALLARLPNQRFWLLSKHGTKSYTDIEFRNGDSLVFGSETNGLPATLLETYSDRVLRIPMQPVARCLNLASSVAIVVYEARRQLCTKDNEETHAEEKQPGGWAT